MLFATLVRDPGRDAPAPAPEGLEGGRLRLFLLSDGLAGLDAGRAAGRAAGREGLFIPAFSSLSLSGISAATEASFERPDGREGLEGGLVAMIVYQLPLGEGGGL